jgi:SH3-like domain-containing protein
MYNKILFWAFSLLMLAPGLAQASTMVSVSHDKSSLHSGPGDKHPVVWTLGVGFPLSAVEEQGDWYRVEDFEGATGWIRKKQVGREPHLIVKAAKANIRSGPSDRYKLIGTANRGVVFKTLKVKGNWVKVKHGKGLTGWVSRSLLWGS